MKPFEQLAWVVLLVASGLHFFNVVPAKASLEGPVHAIILHESGTPTTEFSDLAALLQNPEKKPYFHTEGRILDIWDKDIKDENGVPRIPPQDYEGLTPPLILLYDKRTLVHKEALPRSATADDVENLVKKVSK